MTTILTDLRSRHVAVWLKPDGLGVSLPREHRAELRTEVAAHRDEIVAALWAEWLAAGGPLAAAEIVADIWAVR